MQNNRLKKEKSKEISKYLSFITWVCMHYKRSKQDLKVQQKEKKA